MIKSAFNLLLVIIFLLFSCDSNKDLCKLQENGDVERVVVKLLQIEEEESTSRLYTDENVKYFYWEKNDTVGIFPSIGGQVEFPLGNKENQTTAVFDGGGWALKSTYTYSAYYPFSFYNRNIDKIPISYLGQKQTGNDNRSHLRNYLFFASPPVIVENSSLTLKLGHQGSVMRLELTMPAAKIWSSLSVYTTEDILPVEKTINLQDASLEQTVVSYTDRISLELNEIVTTEEGQKIVVWLAYPSVTADSHYLYVTIRDSEGYAYVSEINKGNGSHSSATAPMNKRLPRYASPVLQQGINSGISDWEKSDKDYGGTVGG
ncbi:MAG: hypothetical protein IJ413_04325 [Bacteroides sp.]|nr:hypothetical protein [Bacteroides sp.]